MKIVSIGSCNRDMVYGLSHIPVGGETIHAGTLAQHWGGKGLNQAVAVARSFAGVSMAGMINRADEDLRDYMRANKLDDALLAYSEQPTGHAIIYVDRQGQNCITVYGGANRALTDAYICDVLSHFDAGDIALVQNETNALDTILREAAARGVRVAMNPSPFDEALLSLPLELVSYFFINEIEGRQMTGFAEPDSILTEMHRRFPKAVVVLTLGEHGALCMMDGIPYRQHAYRTPVVDTTAAGDAFTGYFLAGVAQGLAPETLLDRASRAAAITVSRAGAVVSIPTPDEVAAFHSKAIE